MKKFKIQILKHLVKILPLLLIFNTVNAQSFVVLQDNQGNVYEKVNYDSSLTNSIKLNVYCGYKYIFSSTFCAEITPQQIAQTAQVKRDQEIAIAKQNIAIQESRQESSIYTPVLQSQNNQVVNPIQQATVVASPTIIYQVIEKAVPGPQGPAGPRGFTGQSGTQGLIGPQGPAGPSNSSSGYTPGTQYFGSSGTAGANGANGRDGISITNITYSNGNYIYTFSDGSVRSVTAPAGNGSGLPVGLTSDGSGNSTSTATFFSPILNANSVGSNLLTAIRSGTSNTLSMLTGNTLRSSVNGIISDIVLPTSGGSTFTGGTINDLLSTGVATLTNSVLGNVNLTNTISGAGLGASCSGTNSISYDTATKKFVCGTISGSGGGTSGLNNGTVNGSSLRWSGTNWVENTGLINDGLGNGTSTNSFFSQNINTGTLNANNIGNNLLNAIKSGTTNTLTLSGNSLTSNVNGTISNSIILPSSSGGASWGTISGTLANQTDLQNVLTSINTDIASKQASLLSGTNIKTINGNNILGSGDLVIAGAGGANWGSIGGTLASQTDLQTALNSKQGTLTSGTNIKTLGSNSLLGSGNISLKTINSNSIFGTGDISISGGAAATNTFTQNGNSFGATGILGTNDSNALSIRTNGLERMNIGANGQILMNAEGVVGNAFTLYGGSGGFYGLWAKAGTTTSDSAIVGYNKDFSVLSILGANTGYGIDALAFAATGTPGLFRNIALGTSCTIGNSGTGVVCSSDSRLKENVRYLDSASSLDKILKIKPAVYNWKNSSIKKDTLGVIAQETKDIFPELVSESSRTIDSVTQNYYAVEYSGFIPPIISSIQELAHKISALAEEVVTKTLKTQILCVGINCVNESQFGNMMLGNNIIQQNTQNDTQATTSNWVSTTTSATGTTTDVTTTPIVASTTENIISVFVATSTGTTTGQ